MPSTTRDRLLAAGLRSFAGKGVDGTAIVDLEEAAGLAAGSGGFYRYFRTKDELLDAAVRGEIERVIAERNERGPADRATDPRAALADEFTSALDTLDSLSSLVAILARERARLPGLAREIAGRLLSDGVDHDSRIIAEARGGESIGDSQDSSGRRAAIGSVVLSALVGYYLSTQYFGGAPGGVDREGFIAALVDLVLPDDTA